MEQPFPRSAGVNRGTILTILNRAVLRGLVTTNRGTGVKKPYLFSLTSGGLRRVAWIEGRKFKRKLKPAELRVVANPIEKEEE